MTNLSKLLAASALVAGLAAGAAAFADDRGRAGFGPEGLDFAAIDANGDGVLDRAELTARSTARIAEIDLDADGMVTRAEIVTAMPARGGLRNVFGADPAEARADRMLAMNGATAAGQIEVAVLATDQVNRLLTRADENRDDTLSQAEAEDMRGGRGERGERHAGRGHDDDRRDEGRRGAQMQE